MKFIIIVLLVSVNCVVSRKFESCALAKELVGHQNLPKAEAKHHLCISQKRAELETNTKNSNEYYQISSRWWCGAEGLPAGGCNIQCSDLLNEDITDDVKCAKQIYHHGDGKLSAWGLTESDCESVLNKVADACFEDDSIKTYHPPAEWSFETYSTPSAEIDTRRETPKPVTVQQTTTFETPTQKPVAINVQSSDTAGLVSAIIQQLSNGTTLVLNIFNINHNGDNRTSFQLP